MKLRISIVLMSAAFCGCQSGLYKISTSEDDKKIDGSVRYYDVAQFDDCFIKDNGASPDGILYDENNIPVRITEGQSNRKPDKPGWSGVLWMFSLGLFPMCESEYLTQDITVMSPIGEKTGSYRVDAKRWHGWIPLFVGYPSSADEREANAKLPNHRLERICRERLVKNLIGQFSYSEYRAFARKENAKRKAEIKRIEEAKTKINSFLAKEQYEEAIKFFNLVSLKKEGSLDSDKKIWNELKILIAKAQEDTRVKTKKSILEKKFEEKKFEDVVAECENENTGEERHKNIWEELKTKANESIKARDRKKELSRIEKRKEQISKLLNEKKFAEVIEECNKENGAYPGSRPEDFNIWSSFRNNAQIEKDKIDRAQEESRIAAKIDLVNKLLVDKKFSEVVSLCDEERGQYHGSRPEDLTQWKSIKSKALATDLLSRNDERSQSSFCLKGFYPGMSEEEVVILLDHYFPSLSYSRKSSYIEIPGQAMRFCEIKQGKVVRLNFNKQMLEKLLDIHDQDDENMITYLSNMYHINFRSAHIRDRKSKGSASVSVSQISYTHKNSHKSFCVTYFGEKDISDYNKDPEEIEQEAKARVMSFGNNMAYKDIAYQIGYRAGYAAQCVKIVRAWLKDEYDNGKGAAEGTLRIEYLDL